MNIEKIISMAPSGMRGMLRSVYEYNSFFVEDVWGEELLERILDAMIAVDRKYFVGVKNKAGAYEDFPLSIGEGQTISQPSTVARMLFLADLKKGDDVLEVGGGSGWNACLAGFLVKPGKVVSIERISELVKLAKNNLKKLRGKIKNVEFITENIFDRGGVWEKKYDKIIITAGLINSYYEKRIREIAESLLNDKGVLICPCNFGSLIIYRKNHELKKEETDEEYVFVPLRED